MLHFQDSLLHGTIDNLIQMPANHFITTDENDMFVTTNPAIAKQADTQLAKTTINIICF